MKKIAVFGNAGGGKSTLAQHLAERTGLPLYALDIIRFPGGIYNPGERDGGQITDNQYAQRHQEILNQDEWIIDGYDNPTFMWQRLSAADTLIYIDLPIISHYWGVTRRLALGQRHTPVGWPENTPVWTSTLAGYHVVWRCHRHLTPKYRDHIASAAASKQVHHLRSRAEMKAFLQTVADQAAPSPHSRESG